MKTFYIRESKVQYKKKSLERFEITSSKDVASFVRKVSPDNSREHFFALYLDGAHAVSSYSLISTGTANSTQVHPREVFQAAILSGAISVVIAHTHPSGATKPSESDKTVTRRMIDAGELLGIKILDHVIVTEDSDLSFREEGIL